jgi:hypothetical protein
LNEYELKNFINNFKRVRNGGSIYLSDVPAFAETLRAGKTLAGGSNPRHTGVINVAPTKHQINFNGLWMAMPSWKIKKKMEGELVDCLILFFIVPSLPHAEEIQNWVSSKEMGQER